MPQQAGFELYKKFYPWPERFRLGDPVLVTQVTGMAWPDFISALDELDEDDPLDAVLLVGMAAVAFWQGNQQMSRDKVRRLIERAPQEELELIEGDDGDDAGPPAVAEGGDSPSMTSSASSPIPDSNSDEQSPSSSGSPDSSPSE